MKIWKKITKFIVRLTGRKKKGLFCKEIAKKWRNLKIWVISSSQILPTFCHGNKVKPWKFKKRNTKFIVCLTRKRKKRRKKLFCKEIAKKLQKVPKKNRKKVFQPKIFKFYRGRWTPWSNAPVWAPTSHALADLAKKSQKVPNEKISQKKFFFKFQKRSKKVEKMIAEWTEAVSEGGNRGKVAKKEK